MLLLSAPPATSQRAGLLGNFSCCVRELREGRWSPRAEVLQDATAHERYGVAFEEARELFTTDAPVLEVYDVDHSESEDRFKSIGPVMRGLVLVVWTERSDDLVRIISAWLATTSEQQLYAEYLENVP